MKDEELYLVWKKFTRLLVNYYQTLCERAELRERLVNGNKGLPFQLPLFLKSGDSCNPGAYYKTFKPRLRALELQFPKLLEKFRSRETERIKGAFIFFLIAWDFKLGRYSYEQKQILYTLLGRFYAHYLNGQKTDYPPFPIKDFINLLWPSRHFRMDKLRFFSPKSYLTRLCFVQTNYLSIADRGPPYIDLTPAMKKALANLAQVSWVDPETFDIENDY